MYHKTTELHGRIKTGNFLALAKGITLVENELEGYTALLRLLRENNATPVVGITGPPGAGKSTIVNALLHEWLKEGKKIAVIAVDPSSPFNYGALLGDRVRMGDLYTNPNIYIRSLASRGALGGLNKKIIDIISVVKEAPFDIIIIETVGVGQSEVEIAGLADTTVVALVPEAGDEVQTIKAGIMEIADVFVVNKADREQAEAFYRNLKILVHEKAYDSAEIPVFKTVATTNEGLPELARYLLAATQVKTKTGRQLQLLAEKCWQIMQAELMRDIDFETLKNKLNETVKNKDFNLYEFCLNYLIIHQKKPA